MLSWHGDLGGFVGGVTEKVVNESGGQDMEALGLQKGKVRG